MNPIATPLRAALLAAAVIAPLACAPWAAAQTAPQTAPVGKPKPGQKPPAKAKAAPAAKPGTIKTPASPLDLIRNLKVVLDGHQLLADRFYEDDNLLKVFGATQARWFKLPRPFIKNGKLTGVAHVFELPAGATPPAIDVLYKYVVQGNQEKRRALIGLELPRDSRATIDMAQTVFGKNLKITNPAYNDDPSRVRAPTPGEHPLGNRLVTYEFDAPASSATLSFMVNGDGTLANLMMVEEEKAWKMAPVVVGPGASK